MSDVIIEAFPISGFIELLAEVEASEIIPEPPGPGVFDADLISLSPGLSLTTE